MRANSGFCDNNSSIFTTSHRDSDSDEDEGFQEKGGPLQIIYKFIEKILDKLTIECKITNSHSNQLTTVTEATIQQFRDDFQEIQRAFRQGSDREN
jgi:hypothetical protein